SGSSAGASTIASDDLGPARLTDQTPPTSLDNPTIATRPEPVRTREIATPVTPRPLSTPAPAIKVTKLNEAVPTSARAEAPAYAAPRRAKRPIRVADASPFGPESTYGTLGESRTSQTASDGQIVVRSGDTLYGLSRRHGVSVAALKQANGLNTNVIRPGQTLALPGADRAPLSTYSERTPRTTVDARPPRVVDTTSETHTVRRGDSVYRIARLYGVKSGELMSWNNIEDARRLRPGQVLQVRGPAISGSPAPTSTFASNSPDFGRAPQNRIAAPIIEKRPAAPKTIATRSVTPTIINTRRAASQPTISDAAPSRPKAGQQYARITPPAAEEGGKFRWPARGRIVAGFGPRKNGAHNDGIDILVPRGTDIHAAEAGVVAYANSELKAYGNLVLIRHDNGWVSAYAHADQLLVKRGDRVARGQVIAKAGTTGNVDQPTVHFELRDGAKPVDPRPLLSR
ncbi:MAG: peptidoglycan DD-metalloendopeptidase family protein, partial [Pseudomonadota bacterium]